VHSILLPDAKGGKKEMKKPITPIFIVFCAFALLTVGSPVIGQVAPEDTPADSAAVSADDPVAVDAPAEPPAEETPLEPVAEETPPEPVAEEPVLQLVEDVAVASFSEEIIINQWTMGASDVLAADYNDDGFPDILVTSERNNKFVGYHNTITGAWSLAFVLAGNDTGITGYGVMARMADLDGDGDLDVVTGSYAKDHIAWYANDGSGKFTLAQIVATTTNLLSDLEVADLNGDGLLDIVSAASNDDEVSWYMNEGGGRFSAERVITYANGAQSVCIADLDDDGLPDVVFAAYFDNMIGWVRNDGANYVSSEIRRVISTNARGASAVDAADVDGDGDMDVVSASVLDNKIAWYENLGKGQFGPQQVISTLALGASRLIAVDLDEDMDPDLVSASITDNTIAWYENLGKGRFGEQHVISANAMLPRAVYAADMDQDGDLDILSASNRDNKISWYKNDYITLIDTDGDGIFDIKDNCPALANTDQADFDRDGFGDVCDADVDGDGVDALNGDCNDRDAAIFSGAEEIPYDGIDQDCDNADLVDVDGDGFAGIKAGGNDCNDLDPAVSPGAAEVCGDGLDNDCDGQVDEDCKTVKPGDLTEDDTIGYDDFLVFISTYGKCDGQTGYIAEADYDADNCVTMLDYRIWYTYYAAR
jgi:hypothetical protein